MSFIAANIEQIENAFSLIVLIVGTGMMLWKRNWPSADIRLFARGFLGATLLGDGYWFIYTLVFGHNPDYFYGAELAWLAGELFLLLLVVESYSKEGLSPINVNAWIAPIIIFVLTVWFIVSSGEYVFNILMACAMSGTSLFSLSAIFQIRKDREKGIERNLWLYAASTAFVVLEYAIWTISVLDSSLGISNPYYWIQPLTYLSILFIAYAITRIGKTRSGDDA